MKEIIIDGLGGQGPKLAGDCMVHAAFLEGKYAQARPCFSPERRAGIVMVFYRLDDKPIRKKCTFPEADCLLLMHEYLLKAFMSTGSVSVTAAEMSPEGITLLRLDDSLLRGMLYAGGTGATAIKLKEGGIILANTRMDPKEVKVREDVRPSKIATLDANAISEEIYGKRPIPLVNTIMMGAFAKATGWLKLDSIIAAIRRQWPDAADINSNAAKMAYEATKIAEF